MSHHPKNEEFVIGTRPSGTEQLTETWQLNEVPYPSITEDGQFIYQALYISVDPYMSGAIASTGLSGTPNPLGTLQVGHVLAKVVESKNEKYPVGTLFVSSRLPWRRYSVTNGSEFKYTKLIRKPGDPETFFDRLGLSSAIGALGMPSQTAYYGTFHVGKFTSNDVVVVSGAAGATGSLVGQFAKKIQKAKKVIGIAGGKDKCDWLLELGFDAAIDYKEYNTQEKIANRIREVAGEPVTAYFDNTGGFITDAIFSVIARHGRLIICGQISGYHEPKSYPNYLAKTIYAALTIQGFLVSDFVHLNEKEFFVELPQWLEKGLITARETLVEGFENLPSAYQMLFTGKNIGKIVVKA